MYQYSGSVKFEGERYSHCLVMLWKGNCLTSWFPNAGFTPPTTSHDMRLWLTLTDSKVDQESLHWDSRDSWLLSWDNWERLGHAKVQPTNKGIPIAKTLAFIFFAAILVAWGTFGEGGSFGQNTIFWITDRYERNAGQNTWFKLSSYSVAKSFVCISWNLWKYTTTHIAN